MGRPAKRCKVHPGALCSEEDHAELEAAMQLATLGERDEVMAEGCTDDELEEWSQAFEDDWEHDQEQWEDDDETQPMQVDSESD